MQTNLINKVKEFKNKKILVVGDIMVDHYVMGEVSRVSPEAPVPIMDVKENTYELGGAGNVAVYLSMLGVETYLYGQVGADEGVDIVKSECTEGFNYIGEIIEDYSTTIKNRAVSKERNQIIFRWDKEEINTLRDFDQEELEDALNKVDAVIISDYGKGVVTPEISRFIIERHKKVIVDPKYGPWDHFKGAYIIKPNKKELEEAYPLATRPYTLANEFNSNILITLGSEGINVAAKETDRTENVSTDQVEVCDVTGAGDMVSAVLALSSAVDLNLLDSAYLANIAAAMKVSQQGNGGILFDSFLDKVIEMNTEEIIFKIGESIATLRDIDRTRKKIVFTNGCFDLIHDGHIELLKKAKEKGDFLVVGINSDKSVKKLKGKNRPIQNEKVRSEVLASIKYVDAVVVFGEDDPLQLIKQLEPDVLVKGSDYTVNEIIGAKEVVESGGEVVTVDLIEGSSTSCIVEKIKGA